MERKKIVLEEKRENTKRVGRSKRSVQPPESQRRKELMGVMKKTTEFSWG